MPVILLQFSHERAVLIDNVHQAISQPVAVLAVQARATNTHFFFISLTLPCFSLLTDIFPLPYRAPVPFNPSTLEMPPVQSRPLCWKQFGVLHRPVP